jgi:dihydropteroate synthase
MQVSYNSFVFQFLKMALIMKWQCRNFELDTTVPLVMAIINITPDSFSDGGLHDDVAVACRAVDAAIEAGAAIVDLGAESSRPGAAVVSVEDEWQRLHPVLSYAVKQGYCVSIDTYKPEIMRRAIEMGASIINDIRALTLIQEESSLWDILRDEKIGVCLMHMRGTPQTMQSHLDYTVEALGGDVVAAVKRFFIERVNACLAHGIHVSQLALDVGIGFAKDLSHNIQLLNALPIIAELNYPLLIGVSRKSMIGLLTGEANPQHRLAGSLAAMLYAVEQGAKIVRVHDVKASVEALSVWSQLARVKRSGI